MIDLQEQSAERGAEMYRRELRGTVRGLWSGALDLIDAGAAFDTAIRLYFSRAYNDGAKESGVLPSELTPGERAEREQAIADEYGFVDRFLTAIQNGSKANGGKLAPLLSRVESWVQRYQQIYTRGQMTAKDDPKMLWVQTAAEGCVSCLAVAGKTKRMSTWRDSGFYPQAPHLACMSGAGGVTVCKCHLEQTEGRLTPGPLPISTLV